MDYFIISKGRKGFVHAISKIFEDNKDIKVIPDRRVGNDKSYSGPERRDSDKIERIPRYG